MIEKKKKKETERERGRGRDDEQEDREKERESNGGNEEDVNISELDSSWAPYEIKEGDESREEKKEENDIDIRPVDDEEEEEEDEDEKGFYLFGKRELDQLSVNDCTLNSNNNKNDINNNHVNNNNNNNNNKNKYNDNNNNNINSNHSINVDHNNHKYSDNNNDINNNNNDIDDIDDVVSCINLNYHPIISTATATATAAASIAADSIHTNLVTTNVVTGYSGKVLTDSKSTEIDALGKEAKQAMAHMNGMTECLIMLQNCLAVMKYSSDSEYDARLQQKNEHSVLTMGALCDYKIKLLTTIANYASFNVRACPFVQPLIFVILI